MKRGILLLVLLSLIIVNAQFVVSKTVEIEQVNDLSRREIIQCDSCISCTAATNAPAGTIVQLSQDLATDTNCIEIISSDIILDCNNYRIYKIALLDNDTAIYSYNKNRNEIKNCYIENFKRGIEIYSGEDNVVRDNTLDGAASYGVFLTTNANSNLIVSNDFMGSIYNSVRVVNSDNNMISYNTIEDSQKAIFIKSGSYNTTVVGNYIAGSNFYGLSNEDGSDGTVVMTNMVLNTQQYGMIMKDSSNVLFSGNDIINTGLDVGGGEPYYVIEKRPESKELVVSSNYHPELYKKELEVEELNWFVPVGSDVRKDVTNRNNTLTGVTPFAGDVNLFITPGYQFKVVDALITNFHLPKSTLLAMVSALASREQILNTYKEAKQHNYRFYSFGDAMFIT